MALAPTTDPDTSRLLSRLGLTDEHPLGWRRVTPELREAEWRGLCMIVGRPRRDERQLVVAKTNAGVRAWQQVCRESAEYMRQFPVLDATNQELLAAVFGDGEDPACSAQGR